jgi:hypothetical protein
MGIEDLIAMLESRMSFNATQRAAAVSRGDIALVTALDADDATSSAALNVLRAALN